jgi:hypothetical protein
VGGPVIPAKKALRVVAALLVAASTAAQTANDLQQLDGFPIDVSEAAFVKMRPNAKRMATEDPKSGISYFVYEPKEFRIFGLPVATIGRGFESGRGCTVGLGMADDTSTRMPELLKSTEAAFKSRGRQRTDSSGNEWWYFESPALFGSVMLSAKEAEAQKRSVTFAVSLRACDQELASIKWQTRPR